MDFFGQVHALPGEICAAVCAHGCSSDKKPLVLCFVLFCHACAGVFFVYEMSPFLVQVTQSPVPFTHFVTKLCAIIGGAFTLSGILVRSFGVPFLFYIEQRCFLFLSHRMQPSTEPGKSKDQFLPRQWQRPLSSLHP